MRGLPNSFLLLILAAGCGRAGVTEALGPRAVDGETMPHESPLTQALREKPGDFAAALEAAGYEFEADDAGNVTRILKNLDAADFAEVRRIPTLTNLFLSGETITDATLAGLAETRQIDQLVIDSPHVSDACLVHLHHLKNLTWLSLPRTSVAGEGLRHVPQPERLATLDLTKAPVSDEGLRVLGRFSNLEHLDLWGTQVTDQGLAFLRACPKLRVLNLMETAITDRGVESLVEFPALEEVELDHTKVTDGCEESLLRMPKLKDVSFGMNSIDVATYDQLVAKGVEVRHGGLRNVRRTQNLVRYSGMDFEVDREESSLRASLDESGDVVRWELEIACTRRYVADFMQPAHLDGPPLAFTGPWRDLTGETFRVTYEDQEIHPLTPDTPTGIYIGWHAATNRHEIKFVRRAGRMFLIDWRCDAREMLDADANPVWVSAEVPFTEVVIEAKGRMTLDEALKRFSRHFDRADFLPPRLEETDNWTTATFTVRADVE